MVITKEQKQKIKELSIEVNKVGLQYNLDFSDLDWHDLVILTDELKKIVKKFDKI